MLTPPVLSVFLIRFTTYYKSPILSHMLTRQVLSYTRVRVFSGCVCVRVRTLSSR